MGPFSRAIAAALVLAGALVSDGRPASGSISPVGGTVVSAVDTGDATIRADHPASTYGTTTRLYVRNSVTPASSIEALSYVEFAYNTGSAGVAAASLRLHATSTTTQNVCVFRVPWTFNERTLSWNTAPASLDRSTIVCAHPVTGQWMTFDVTSLGLFAAGAATVTFGIEGPNTQVGMSSKEDISTGGSYAPGLNLTLTA